MRRVRRFGRCQGKSRREPDVAESSVMTPFEAFTRHARQAMAPLDCERLAITLPLPHLRHRSLLTNCAIGAAVFMPNRTL
jgi:hypothetical protein